MDNNIGLNVGVGHFMSQIPSPLWPYPCMVLFLFLNPSSLLMHVELALRLRMSELGFSAVFPESLLYPTEYGSENADLVLIAAEGFRRRQRANRSSLGLRRAHSTGL